MENLTPASLNYRSPFCTWLQVWSHLWPHRTVPPSLQNSQQQNKREVLFSKNNFSNLWEINFFFCSCVIYIILVIALPLESLAHVRSGVPIRVREKWLITGSSWPVLTGPLETRRDGRSPICDQSSWCSNCTQWKTDRLLRMADQWKNDSDAVNFAGRN